MSIHPSNSRQTTRARLPLRFQSIDITRLSFPESSQGDERNCYCHRSPRRFHADRLSSEIHHQNVCRTSRRERSLDFPLLTFLFGSKYKHVSERSAREKFMAIETMSDILSELADQIGVYGACDEKCTPNKPCRCHWESDLYDRIKAAIEIEKRLQATL
jgi:hypothetical protein